jgi:bla regulator protein blaR1
MQIQGAAVFAIVLVPVLAAAQQFLPAPPGAAVDPNTRFEVVSIKAGEAGGPVATRSTPGRFETTNMPLGFLLRQALQRSDYQIAGLAGWIDSERYSIRATAPESIPPTANTTMLLNLLKDRFQLVTHPEIRELPIFNLVIARADGRLGPALKATAAECQAVIAERNTALTKAAAGGGAPPPFPPLGDPNGPPPCGFQRIGPGAAAGSGRAIADLVPFLADLVSRPVLDKTGLAGLYDFALKFAPESAGSPGILRLLSPGAPPPTGAGDANSPSLAAALQEQLGLKLEGGRGPVDVVVIDKFERPTLD